MLLYISAQDRAALVRKPEICAPVTVFLPAYTGAQQRAAGSATAGVCGARGEGVHRVGASSGGCGPVQHAGDAGQAGAHLPSGTRHAGTRRPGPPTQVRISPLWLSGFDMLGVLLSCVHGLLHIIYKWACMDPCDFNGFGDYGESSYVYAQV